MAELLLDHTKLSSLVCSTRAAVRHVLHLAPPTDAVELAAGSAIHLAEAIWLETGGDDSAALAALKKIKWSADGKDRLDMRRVRTVLAHHFKSRPYRAFPIEVEPGHIEIAAEADLGELKDGTTVRFIALLDAVGRKRGTGGWWLVDHKSTGRLGDWWEDDQTTSDQFIGQKWVGTRVLPDHTIVGVMVHGMEFPNQKTSTRRCSDHGMAYKDCDLYHVQHKYLWLTKTPHELVTWERTAMGLARKFHRLQQTVSDLHDVRELPMEGRFFRACSRCELRAWCDAGRPAHGVGDGWVEKPWDPRAHAGMKRRLKQSELEIQVV